MTLLKCGIGIDISKDKFDVCLSIIDDRQAVNVKAQSSFLNNKNGFVKFWTWTIKNAKKFNTPVTYLMEATGIYYEQLAWFLHIENAQVSVIIPNKAKKYKDALGLKSKNDSIDAKGLAQMSCEQKIVLWKPISKNLYNLRLVTRQLQNIGEQITVFKNQLHALTIGIYRDKLIEKMYENQIKIFNKNKAVLENKVKDVIKTDPVLCSKFDKVCKIKGLGILSLANIVAETDGFAAFESASQLVSYAGYDIVENQSGKKSGKTKISKKGNSRIRKALHFPAFNMITYKIKPFTELYERVYEKNRIKMKAYTAVQRKLLVIIYTLWKKDEEFDGDFQDRASREKEQEPSLTFLVNEKSVCKKIALEFTRATLDRHPSKYRRLPSLT